MYDLLTSSLLFVALVPGVILSVGSGARTGAGFGIGAGMVGFPA